VLLWSKHRLEPSSKIERVQDLYYFDGDRTFLPLTEKTWTGVGNNAFVPGDCHGSNNSVFSKSGLV